MSVLTCNVAGSDTGSESPGSDGSDDASNMAATPAAPAPLPGNNIFADAQFNIRQLLRRPVKDMAKHVVVPLNVTSSVVCDEGNTYQLHELQTANDEYCKTIREGYTDEFWRIFDAVYQERTVVIDKVLKVCKDTFVPRKMKKRFANSVRSLRANSLAIAGHVPSMVMHQKIIDLREFSLPGNLVEVKFKFVNPLWAWASAANDMVAAGHKLHYQPKVMLHETTNARLYGAGVAFGEKLMWAAKRTPFGGKPALFGISFDGGDSGVSDRSLYPICVSVLNVDGADPAACWCVGYVPILQVPKVFKKNKKYLRARAHVFQRCIGAILDELEAVSRDGFAARVGGETIRFHPYLVAVRVDSKERKTYFGLKSDRSCAICRFRKGWSSLRTGTAHGKRHIQRLWKLAIDDPRTLRRNARGRAQKRAREQLCRHGFHKRQRCTLLDHAKSILLRDPLQRRQSLFAGVIFNDLLHWEKNCCDYAFEALAGVMTKAMKLECDENVRRVPPFRKADGTPLKRFFVVSDNTYLTTARRLTLTFMWTHALGTKALMLPAPCRMPALTVVSHLQIIILACQGRRSYSEEEWGRLLVDTAFVFFDAMQFLMHYKEQHDTSANATVFTPMRRYINFRK
jgi:hypothetical protein